MKVRRRKEVHYRRKPKPKKDESQAPLNADDPRASAANQLELQGEEEVSDEAEQEAAGRFQSASLRKAATKPWGGSCR